MLYMPKTAIHALYPHKGFLITMIHKWIAFSGNITKILTPIKLSPYLQILTIVNGTLTPILLWHLYMQTHKEDLHKILLIQWTIELTIASTPTYFPMLKGEFNCGIFLIGCQNLLSLTILSSEDKEWQAFTANLQLTPTPNTTEFTRQGRPKFKYTSVIDDHMFLKPPNSPPM